MIDVVWRVSGDDFDVDAFLQDSNISPSTVWRKGEQNNRILKRHNTHDDSGFNLTLAETTTVEKAVTITRESLKRLRPFITQLSTSTINSAIDFGVSVGGNKNFTRSIYFDLSFLEFLIALGVELEITVYPISDEED